MYTPHTWVAGDEPGEEDFNRIETGVNEVTEKNDAQEPIVKLIAYKTIGGGL